MQAQNAAVLGVFIIYTFQNRITIQPLNSYIKPRVFKISVNTKIVGRHNTVV